MAQNDRKSKERDFTRMDAQIYEIINGDIDEKSHEALSELIELRRGPQGRLVVVYRGSATEVRALTPDEIVRIGSIYDWKRKPKRRQYLKLIGDANYKGPRVVCEGDSYFEHPLPKDLIEWTGETYAVLSLAKAGDTWLDYVMQEGQYYDDKTPMGLFETIKKERPQIVLMSGGGNEVLGSIEDYVRDFDNDRPWDEYVIMQKFETVLKYSANMCTSFAKAVAALGVEFVVHTYDYPDPRSRSDGGQYIGGPLQEERGIPGVYMWRTIVNQMIDLHHDRVAAALKGIKRAHLLDLRGTIGNPDPFQGPDSWYWWDEIHPSKAGSELFAKKFKAKIKEISGA